MKVLEVTSMLPYPLNHATRIRAWNLLTRLAKTDEVTLVTWLGPDDSPESIDECRKRFHDVIVLPGETRTPAIPTRLLVRIKSTLKRIPPYIELMKSNRGLAEPMLGRFDVAVAQDDAALLLMPDVDCPRVVHRHNIFSETLEGLRRSGELGLMHRLKWSIELPMWRRFDRMLSTLADVSIVTTDEAKIRLGDVVPSARIEVVRNGSDILDRLPAPGATPRVVFLGTLNYEPNVDAVLRFIRYVWPKVLTQVPQAEFHVIGRAPAQAFARMRHPGVVIKGEVDDIVDGCAGARLGVVPLYAGSGIKTKTLDMMSMGLPVVATELGCEGIGRNDGLERVWGDDEMANAVVVLLRDRDLAARRGEAGRAFVKENFSWEESAISYRRVLQAAVDSSKVR